MNKQRKMKPSNEATAHQLELARRQGEAYGAAIAAMAEQDGVVRTEIDDYAIGLAVEEAEGLWRLGADEALEWSAPHDPEQNTHVEVVVADRIDGRFVPELAVQAEVVCADGTTLGRAAMPFLWHPFLYHYGHNWHVPGPGTYTVNVHIDAPSFYRHDPVNGRRYARPVDVQFSNVHIEPGRKPSPGPSPRVPASGPVE